MKEGTYIPPAHWDNQTFCKLVEFNVTTPLEQAMFARLATACQYEVRFNEEDIYTYSREDLLAKVADQHEELVEQESHITDLALELHNNEDYIEELKSEVESLRSKLEELEAKYEELEADYEDLEDTNKELRGDLF